MAGHKVNLHAKQPRMKKSDPWRYQSSKWRPRWTTGGYCRMRSIRFNCKNDGKKCDQCIRESEYRK